jgi:PAS domain S-box-containing protein
MANLKVSKEIDPDTREKDERLRLALGAAGLGTWEMDMVHNKRHWSQETAAMHGLPPSFTTKEHIELTDSLMHPEDRVRLQILHQSLRDGLDDYLFEYRTILPSGEERWISARGKVLEREPEGPTRIVGVSADVTTHKKLQLAEEQQDFRFHILADSLPQLVWIADGSGRVTYYNSRRMHYYKATEKDGTRQKWQPLIHPDDLTLTQTTWAKAMKGAHEYEMEHRLRMADGTFRWHITRATSVKTAQDKVTMWFGTATDIDRLKQAETHVRAGVERLQVATQAASMFGWELDFKTGKLNWADNAAEVIGCSPDQILNEQLAGSFFVHPDDRQRLRDQFSKLVEKKAERFEIDFRGVPRSGRRTFWRTAGKFLKDSKGDLERAVGVTQNVTNHVEAAAQLKLLDERLTTAEEGARALVYDWDIQSDHVWRSPTMKRVLGWDPSEVSSNSKAWQNLIHPDDRATIAQLKTSDMLEPDDHYTVEYRVLHKDGNYRWMMDSGRVFRNSEGTIVRQAGTTLDVSARKKMEMAHQRMASLIELSFEPIFVWQPESGILEWNRGAELLYGISQKEALGKKPHTLLRTRYPLPFDQFMAHLLSARNWSGEIENFDLDGQSIMVESRYQVIRFDSDIVILETNRDIRERKRAETHVARMAAIAEASHDALYGANLNGIIEAWNPGAFKLLGYEAEEALGQHISMLAAPAQHAEQLQFLKVVADGKTVKPFDTVRKAKDGRLIDVSIAMSPVRSADGTVVATSVALHDISERKEWDRHQRLMNRELAHRVKNSFAILQAILRSTLRTSSDPERFAEAFSGRLHSMAKAHDILTESNWRGAELGALVRHQLSQYVTGQRIHFTGGLINLAAEHAAPLSLIFNELATNALKHGALSVATGRIDIAWEITKSAGSDAIITISWTETGGLKIAKVGARSFGITLIERSLAESTVTLDFKPEGLVCKISWPVSTISRQTE